MNRKKLDRPKLKMDRSIARFLWILAPFILFGCTEGPDTTLAPEAEGLGADPGRPLAIQKRPVVLDAEVKYYYDTCGHDATQDGVGDWSFPAGGGIPTGGKACLIANVTEPSNFEGHILWQICGDLASTGRGTSEECDLGSKTWVAIPGEEWTQLDEGHYTSASHSTAACNGFKTTLGYRYLYSPGSSQGAAGGMASPSFNVTSDGTVPPPGGCPS